MSSKPAGEKGFALIEVLIALTILTIGILAIVGMFPFVFKLNSNAWNLNSAMMLAQEKAEELKQAKTFISESAYTTDYPSSVAGSGGYRRWIGVQSGNTMLQLTYVEVRWVEKGRVREVRVLGSIFKE